MENFNELISKIKNFYNSLETFINDFNETSKNLGKTVDSFNKTSRSMEKSENEKNAMKIINLIININSLISSSAQHWLLLIRLLLAVPISGKTC